MYLMGSDQLLSLLIYNKHYRKHLKALDFDSKWTLKNYIIAKFIYHLDGTLMDADTSIKQSIIKTFMFFIQF